MQKLRSIQVLRAVAACSVVLFHAYTFGQPRDPTAQVGAAGVDLFFVISGFIMANVAKGRTAGRFLFDRFWRVYPLWWIAVIPWIMFNTFRTHLGASLSLWPVWGGAFAKNGFSYPALTIGWTLCFEMLFYLGMALAIRTRPIVPLAIFAVCLPFSGAGGLVGFLGSPMILEFLLGVAIAYLPKMKAGGFLLPVGAMLLFWAPGGSVLSYWVMALNAETAIYRAALWGLPAALIVYGALCLGEWKSRRWNLPVLLGDASYSIYLFHLGVVLLAGFHWLVEVALSIVVGVAIHILVERRIIRAKPLGIKHHAEPAFTVVRVGLRDG